MNIDNDISKLWFVQQRLHGPATCQNCSPLYGYQYTHGGANASLHVAALNPAPTTIGAGLISSTSIGSDIHPRSACPKTPAEVIIASSDMPCSKFKGSNDLIYVCEAVNGYILCILHAFASVFADESDEMLSRENERGSGSPYPRRRDFSAVRRVALRWMNYFVLLSSEATSPLMNKIWLYRLLDNRLQNEMQSYLDLHTDEKELQAWLEVQDLQLLVDSRSDGHNNSRSEHVPALADAQFEFHVCCRRRENCRRNNQNSELCSQIKGLATRRPEKGLEINRLTVCDFTLSDTVTMHFHQRRLTTVWRLSVKMIKLKMKFLSLNLRTVTRYPDIDPFLEETEEEEKSNDD
ncbi:hypothetical protein Tco_1219587 [Tanacetum coccineum]